LEGNRRSEETELKALRERLLDLQSQSDDKEEIGGLHRQMVALQIREKEFAQRNQLLSSKCARLEAQLFRQTRKGQELEIKMSDGRSQAQVQ